MTKTDRKTSADNSIYDTHAADWWNEDSFLHTLKTGINPARFGYFRSILDQLGINLASLRVLDVGCGGGILSEEFARLGCNVTGVDISSASVNTASRHAQQENLKIVYLAASGESLPLQQASFDVVVCCDVLEHVEDLNQVLAEAARVLKPGGIYLFDTINRSLQSYIETILVAQEIPFTRFFAPGTHAWRQFIRPVELTIALGRNNLQLQQLAGLQPGISPLATLREILRLKLGKINHATFGHRLKFQRAGSLNGSYMGYAGRTLFTQP